MKYHPDAQPHEVPLGRHWERNYNGQPEAPNWKTARLVAPTDGHGQYLEEGKLDCDKKGRCYSVLVDKRELLVKGWVLVYPPMTWEEHVDKICTDALPIIKDVQPGESDECLKSRIWAIIESYQESRQANKELSRRASDYAWRKVDYYEGRIEYIELEGYELVVGKIKDNNAER